MDNLEKSVPNFEGFDISGNTQLPGNNLLSNDILALDTSTDGSFQDPLLDNNEITPLTLEEGFTGEISESEIALINLSSLNSDDSIEPLIGDLQPQAALSATLEPAEAGVFTVNTTGEFTIDFLFDAGSYKSELAVFSLAGMEGLTPGSSEYIKEAASRALTNSESGYIIIADDSEGAKLTGELGESDKNEGNYSGIKSFSMNPGDDFAFMLIPQGKVQDVFDNPGIDGDQRPLFSIASANPGNATQMMQLLDGAIDGGVFGIEDLRLDKNSDADFNDIIFHVKGAAGKATPLIDVVNTDNPWYETPLGGELIEFAQTNNSFDEPSEISVGLVNDTGSSSNDGITNDPSLSGSISNPSQVASLKAGFNGLVDISDSLKSDGSFSLDKEKLEQINNGSLTDGDRTLTLQAEDSSGNILDTQAFTFTLDTLTQAATKLSLLGVEGSVTNDNTPTITGEAESGSKVELFSDGELVGETTVNSPWEITTDALADGLQSITAKATDVAGNVSEVSQALEFTVDTTASQINITSPVADAELANGARLTGKLDEAGSGMVNLIYQFGDRTPITVPVNDNSEFDVELDFTGISNGSQTLTITSTDFVGNVTTQDINLDVNLEEEDTTAPVITADLTTDSGNSDSDKITNNPAINGSITDNSEITSFKAGFDDTATENFVDVLAQLQPDGSFSFDAAKLKQINGDVDLSEGENTLKLIATDAVGNTNEVLEFTFTLDTQLPSLTVNNPSASDELTEGAKLTGSLDETGAGIVSLTYQFSGGSEITVPVNDNGEFDVELDFAGISNGSQTLTITSTDLAGNITTQDINVNIGVVDTTPPTAIISSNLIDTPSSFEVTYNEAVSDEAFATGNYTLTISGGDNDGQTVEISSVEKVSDTIARLTLAAPLTQTNYQLALGKEIKDLAGNAIAENTTLDFSVAPPAVTISPTNGEEMVALTRETIVRFNTKVDPSTVNDESFYVIANGERLTGRIVVSSTEKFATFFYDEPLPQSTEVRVVVDGDKIKSRNGVAIDGNRDGIAGGIATADFTTLPLTRIEGTDVFGYVYDSYNKNEDGSNIPLEGVVIRLDSLPDVFAVTDENGYFKLEDVPAPDFYVYIDASNVTNVPEGTQYASLGKAFHSVPGQEIQLEMDGEPFNIYLPTMAESDIVELSSTEETAVGFGTESLAFLQQEFPDIDPELWQETQVMFAPGSAQDDGGTTATRAMIVPVNPERLPAPLPPNMEPGLVISIQAGSEDGFNRESQGGATNFDVPAPVAFPNLEGLAPGEKSLIWSFDHDAGDWVVIGTGTVSDDGKSIVSDEGVGILAPGWHFVQSGAKNEYIILLEEPPVIEIDDSDDSDDRVTFEAGIELDGEFIPLQVEGKFGFELPTQFFENLGGDAFQPLLWEPKLTIPEDGLDFGTNLTRQFTVSDFWSNFVPELDVTLFDAKASLGIQGQASAQATITGKELNPVGEISGTIGANVSLTASAQISDTFLCTLPWGIGNFFCQNFQFDVPLIGSPQFDIGPIDFTFPITPVIDFTETIGPVASLSASTNIRLSPRIFIREVEEDIDAPVQEIETNFSTSTGFGEDTSTSYRIILENGFEITGKTQNGQLTEILPPDTGYTLYFYNPSTNRSGIISGRTDRSGSCEKNSTPLPNFGGSDIDDDGIPDIGEYVIGTDPNNPDTDGDGILDNIELEEGLNPLGEQPPITGVIATPPLRGEAREVEVVSQLINVSPVTIGRAILPDNIATQRRAQIAYVATGSYGLAAVDVSQFNNPIILGQLDLPGGDATDVAVDTNLQIAAVATGTGALKLVDVSDPMLPKVEQTINIPANQVEIVNGIAYATVGTLMYAIDLATGEELQQLNLGGSGTVTDIAREGEKLYTYVSGSDTFSVIDISDETQANILGQLRVSVASRDVGVFAANGVAYLAGSGLRTIDVSDPTNPTLISNADNFFTARDLALNGSGLALVATENQGVGIYDINDPTNTNNFITQIDTSGFTYDVAIASGIAYVADGSGGLQVINYRPFDNQGQAPTNVSINSLVTDTDPETPGIQVVEGSTLSFTTAVEDDVQVRNVELLFNGEVVQNDLSFPFDLSGIAPNITPDNNQLEVQVRATDTGGNSTLSEILTFDLLPDTSAPEVANTNPENNGVGENVKAISIRFNENIDTSRINLSGITLTSLGADGTIGGGDDSAVALAAVETPSNRRLVVLLEESLPIGKYQLTLDPSIIADNAGNSLESPLTLEFTATKTLAFSRTDFPVGEKPSGMTSADFDGDGDIDLAVAHPGRINANSFNGNTVSILFNNGEGSFSEPVDLTTEVGPQVQSGDFNGDGNIDLAVNSLENDNLAIYLNNGNGEFTQSGIFDTGERPITIPPADLDGDGDLDLVVLNTIEVPSSANNTGDSFSVFFNDGNANFATPVNYTLNSGLNSISTGDLDSDGDLDLAIVNRRTEDIFLLYNDGEGNFNTSEAEILNNVAREPIRAALGDLNGDNNLDIIVNRFVGSGSGVYTYLNNGDGTFAQRVFYNTPSYPGGLINPIDFDLDGDLDIAISHAVVFLGSERTEGNKFTVLRNNGDGTFKEPLTIEVGNFPGSPVVADLDEDGDVDTVTSNGDDGTISVLKNEII